MSEDKIIDNLQEILEEFTRAQPEVQGQILIAFPEGVPIADTWKGIIDPVLLGALSAAVKLTFQKLCLNLRKGNLKRLFMNSDYGRVIIQNTGNRAILTTIMEEEADLFRIAFELSSLTVNINDVLVDYVYE